MIFCEIGKRFWELVTEIEVTQTRAIFGGAIFTDVVVSLVSEMEALCGSLNDKYLLTLKHLHKHERKRLYSTQTKWGMPRDI